MDTGAPTVKNHRNFPFNSVSLFKGMCTCTFHSLRKQPTFWDATSSFSANWCLRNECRNPY